MKVLVLYDSVFGNTEKIAQAVAAAFPETEVLLRKVGQVQPADLAGLDLLVAGSPTRGFRPTSALTDFLKTLPAGSLKGVAVTAFDTRIDSATISSPIFRFFVNLGGYAAPKLAKQLTGKGGQLALPSEGFIVNESEGPLRTGELERAAAWIKTRK